MRLAEVVVLAIKVTLARATPVVAQMMPRSMLSGSLVTMQRYTYSVPKPPSGSAPGHSSDTGVRRTTSHRYISGSIVLKLKEVTPHHRPPMSVSVQTATVELGENGKVPRKD